ncbi:MAG: type II toxin-antitoxin system RelE/ParE family toxin [Nitrospiria bacterium]
MKRSRKQSITGQWVSERSMLGMVVFGPNLGMPFTRSMGENLFEIRARGKEGIGRVFFYTVVGHKIVILHAFIKKTNKTPRKELDIARKRLSEVRSEKS